MARRPRERIIAPPRAWRPPPRTLTAVAVACVLAVSIWSGARGDRHSETTATDSGPDAGYVHTFLSYLDAGHRDVLRFLDSEEGRASGMEAAIAPVRDAVVRVRVHFDRRDGFVRTSHGSGFVLAGGRHVVTAAHVLHKLDERDDCELVVALADGSTLDATRIMSPEGGGLTREHDWAVLELSFPTDAPGLRVARTKGYYEIVAALGFPDQFGLADADRVVKDETEFGFAMRPLVILGNLLGEEMEPIAGAMPLGGISGGPVIDARGRVIGIDTGRRDERIGNGNVRFTIVVTPTLSLRDWLEDNLPETVTD